MKRPWSDDIDPRTIPDEVLRSERGRRNAEKRVSRRGGRPKVMGRCACGFKGGTVEMRAHKKSGKPFPHGTAYACDQPGCKEVNAPIDCVCGFVVSASLDGVLDFDMNLRRWS